MNEHVGEWPEADLEHLDACPVCGDAERQPLHDDLTDITFDTAPGRWSMWSCARCRSAYLDPRPSSESIGRAYASYYTHGVRITGGGKAAEAVKDALRRDYLNRTRSYRLRGSLPLSRLLLSLKPKFRGVWDFQTRHLPPPAATGGALLDIGCGSGDFLPVARELGYDARGLEPDEKAVELCRNRGFSVRQGGLPDTGEPEATYDHVTLTHVIEHVHDPLRSLREIARILKPGGRVWMTYPNIDSAGHARFGKFWRGLEVPRHLTLMPAAAVSEALDRAGFRDVVLHEPPADAVSYYQRSAAMQSGLDQHDNAAWTEALEVEALAADAAAKLAATTAEALTITAYKA